MQKDLTILAMAAKFLAVSAGVAFATIKYGTPGPDNLQGTSYGDSFYGYGGDERLAGGSGDELLQGQERQR
jgi:hypothetical protein